jgi:hypothetical protein
MATAEVAPQTSQHEEPWLRLGSWLMGLAAVGFIGYAVLLSIRNFTDSFVELGIGPNEVNVGKDRSCSLALLSTSTSVICRSPSRGSSPRPA